MVEALVAGIEAQQTQQEQKGPEEQEQAEKLA